MKSEKLSVQQAQDKKIKSSGKVSKKVESKRKPVATKTQAMKVAGPKKASSVANAALSVSVYGKDGKAKGRVVLPKEIFGAKINPILMAQAVRVYLANQRGGTASTKTRGEVQGSTRKIYRQKGTGRARHGGIRAPIFVGGGIVFGPRPRDFSLKLPTKMKRAALFSALSAKLQDEMIRFADGLETVKGKTKEVQKLINALNFTENKKKIDKILLVLPAQAKSIEQAARNIEGMTLIYAKDLTTYTVLVNKYIIFSKDAIPVLSETFLKEKESN